MVSSPLSGGQPRGMNDCSSILLCNMLSISLSGGRYYFLCVVNVPVQGSVFDCAWVPHLRDSFLSKQDWDAYLLLYSVPTPDSCNKGCAYLSRKRESGVEVGNLPSFLPSTPFLLLTDAEQSAKGGSPWERVAEWEGDLKSFKKWFSDFLLGDANKAIKNQNATERKQKRVVACDSSKTCVNKRYSSNAWEFVDPLGNVRLLALYFKLNAEIVMPKKKKESWRKFFPTCCSLWLGLQVKVLKPYWLCEQSV